MINMPPFPASFKERGGWLLDRLALDFGLTDVQAAGIVGNLGFESNGFRTLQEMAPVGFGRGGYGWAQWTGPRRRQFEAYSSAHNISPASDEANFGFLEEELNGAYKYVLQHLKKTTTIEAAVFTFGYYYEAPGGTTAVHLPGYDGRLKYAKQALEGAGQVPIDVSKPVYIPPPVLIKSWWQRLWEYFR